MQKYIYLHKKLQPPSHYMMKLGVYMTKTTDRMTNTLSVVYLNRIISL